MATSLTLDAARRISDATRAKGRDLGLHPLTVAVLDAGGHVKVLEREDGASLLRPQIAFSKAWGALGMGLPSRLLAERATRDPAFVGSLGPVSDGQVVPGAGGVLIVGAHGVIGAVGVSGDTPDNDETCAVAGIEAAGLTADTEASPAPRSLEL